MQLIYLQPQDGTEHRAGLEPELPAPRWLPQATLPGALPRRVGNLSQATHPTLLPGNRGQLLQSQTGARSCVPDSPGPCRHTPGLMG